MNVSLFRVCKKAIILALCGGLAIVCGVSYAGENNMIVFHEYLTRVGDKLDCFFTVESVGQTGSLNNPILDAMVDVDVKAVQDLNSVIASLANDITIVWKAGNVTNRIGLVVDKTDLERPIVRIRDARLASVKHYALDEQVSLKYAGTLDGLLSSLSARNSLIQRQRIFSVGMGPIVVDVQTQVRVAAQDKAVRDVLTECIPISGYSRVIWSSYTNGKEESPSVTIKFHGTRKKAVIWDVSQQITNQNAAGVSQIPGSGKTNDLLELLEMRTNPDRPHHKPD